MFVSKLSQSRFGMVGRFARLAAAAAVMLTGSDIAAAYTECTVTPSSIFAGDEGAFYIVYSNGGSGVIVKGDPDFEQTVALVTAAILSDRDLGVRYAADSVSCSATMQSLVGVRLYR